MSAALVAFLTVLSEIAPALGSSSAIQAVINTLIQIIPTLIQEVEDLVPLVKNIISGLQSNSNITPDQWAQLDQLNQSADAGFEAEASQFNPDGTPIAGGTTSGSSGS